MNVENDENEVQLVTAEPEEHYPEILDPNLEPDTEYVETQTMRSRHTGLIRIALVALLVLVNVYFVQRLWGEQIASLFAGQKTIAEQTAPVDPMLFAQTVEKWKIARQQLLASQVDEKAALADIASTQKSIAQLEDGLVTANADIDRASQNLASAQKQFIAAEATVAALKNSTVKADLAQVKSELAGAKRRLLDAQARLKTARANAKKIEHTVEQLARASEAAEAAMRASEAAAAAAAAAESAINAADGDQPSVLSQLATDIFSTGQSQVSGAQRASEATANALATSEAQLAEASEIEAERLDDVKSAKRQLALLEDERTKLQRALNRLGSDKKEAQRVLRSSQAAITAAQQELVKKEALRVRIEDALSKAGAILKNAQSRIDASQGGIAEAQAQFKRIDAELVKLRKQRALRNALVLAEANQDFTDKLRRQIGGFETIDPASDGFAFSQDNLFTKDSTSLSEIGQAQMGAMLIILNEAIARIPNDVEWILRVDGHTDPASTSDDGWKLSQERARAVVNFLTTQHGFPASNISANGFGRFQPLYESNGPQERNANQRIQLQLTTK